MEKKEEQLLWNLFRKGDKKAFEDLFLAFNPTLVHVGRSMTHDALLVEDCIQDVFIDLWNKHLDLPEVQTVKYYLIVCFRRLLLANIKKGAVQVDWNVAAHEEAVESREYKMIEEQLVHTTNDKLRNGIDRLPDRQKQIIELRYMKSLSYEEICQEMSINYTSSRKLVYKAITNLKIFFGEERLMWLWLAWAVG